MWTHSWPHTGHSHGSEAIATNDDDDACSGGASTLTVDVDAVASGEPFDLFIAVGYRQRPKPATTGASRASKRGVHYELLLMCEDLPVLALEQATPHLDLLADAVAFGVRVWLLAAFGVSSVLMIKNLYHILHAVVAIERSARCEYKSYHGCPEQERAGAD